MNMFIRILFLFLLAPNVSAIASQKYCLKEGERYDVHVFGETFEDQSHKKLALKGLSDLKNKFKYGDKVRLFIHKKTTYDIAIDSCIPGCPERQFIDQFFSNECNVMVAKKDYQEFHKNFASKILANMKSEKSDYDIFLSVQSLADVYKNTSQKDAIYSAISLIPKGVDPKNRTQLTKLYVEKREALKFPTAFPKVKLIGNSINQELIKFWKDIFQDKVEIEFDSY
jgi:hypothetical protein